jgi:pimeloyl-ACP methyl ester carboxylesterase
MAVAVVENSTTVRAPSDVPLALHAVRGGMRLLSRLAPGRAAALAEHMFLRPRRHRRSSWEKLALARARRIELGRLSAWAWGDDDAPTVVLVHGWEGRGSQLAALADPLFARGFRVIAFDAPAHGDSPGNLSSIVGFAEAIEAAARAFGPLHAIVAHSMGGAAALWAGRSGGLAERLVLVSPPKDVRDFTRHLAGMLGLPESVRQRVHARLGERFGVPVESFQAGTIAAKGKGPLLVIHDQDDKEVPIACGESIAAAWPGAELVRTRGKGHHRILRDPDVVATIVGFVADRAAAATGGR